MVALEVELHAIPVHLYTTETFLAGTLHTIHQRLSDAVNADAPEIELRDALIISLADRSLRWRRRRAIVLKRNVVFLSDRPTGTYRPSRPEMTVERERQTILVGCAGFLIDGAVHLPPGGSLSARLTAATEGFIPITDARVSAPWLGSFDEHAVLVNVRHIVYVAV